MPRKADARIRAFVDAMKKENAKLQTRVATLEVKLLSADNRIAALRKGVDPLDELSPTEVATRIAELRRELGIEQMKKRIAELEQKLDETKP